MGLCFIRSWPAGIGFANRWELVDVRINPFIVEVSYVVLTWVIRLYNT